MKKVDKAVQSILGDVPEPTPMPTESDALADLHKRWAEAAQDQCDQTANEIVGELGMKAAGQAKAIRSFDGSPLFGESQGSLFPLDKPNNKD